MWLATLVIVLVGLTDLAAVGLRLNWTLGWLVVLLLALAARAHRSTPILVLAIANGYFWVVREFELEFFADSKLGALGLILALALALGAWLRSRAPRVLDGLHPQRPYRFSSRTVVVWFAGLCAIISSLRYEFATSSFSLLGMHHVAVLPSQLPFFADGAGGDRLFPAE